MSKMGRKSARVKDKEGRESQKTSKDKHVGEKTEDATLEKGFSAKVKNGKTFFCDVCGKTSDTLHT